MFLLLDAATGLSEIRVRRYFDYAYSQMYTCRIGNPSGSYRLPPNLSFTIGTSLVPGSKALLELNRTRVSVSNAVTLGDYSVVSNNVDGCSFDPTGTPLAHRRVYCAQDLTPGQPWLTLGPEGAYTVWLTVEDYGGAVASNWCTVTVIGLRPAVTNSLTWDGGAAMEAMDRSHWQWGCNWVGDSPPAHPTLGTVTFEDLGLATNRLECDRNLRGRAHSGRVAVRRVVSRVVPARRAAHVL